MIAAPPRWSPRHWHHGYVSRLACVSVSAVEITGLVKRYGPVAAVDSLTFAAPRREVTALLGPNGAGKTTTVEICEGYRRPDAGKVRVLGLDPVRDARALRPQVGVMPQSGGIPPAARPGEYLRLLASFHARPADPAALLDRLGLAAAMRTPVRRLSGGSNSGSHLPPPSSAVPNCCSSTSRPQAWTRRPGTRHGTSSLSFAA